MSEFKTVDCPVKFEGDISMKTKDGRWVNVTFTFGYGSIPTKASLRDSLNKALKEGSEQTGMDLSFPTPTEFMNHAASEMCGARVSVGCMAEEYEVIKKGGVK